jgi:hypothetical protein
MDSIPVGELSQCESSHIFLCDRRYEIKVSVQWQALTAICPQNPANRVPTWPLARYPDHA